MPSESHRAFPPRGSCFFRLILGIQPLPDGVAALGEVLLHRIGLGMRELTFAKELCHVVAGRRRVSAAKGISRVVLGAKSGLSIQPHFVRARRMAAAAPSGFARWSAAPTG